MLFLAAVFCLLVFIYWPLINSFFFIANDFDLIAVPLASRIHDLRWFDFSPKYTSYPFFPHLLFHILWPAFRLRGSLYALACVGLLWGNCCLVFLLAKGFSRNGRTAVWATLFFAAMTTHVYCAGVLYVTLTHGLAVFCLLSSSLCLREFSQSRRERFYVAALGMFLCGLLSHELALLMLVVAPLWLWTCGVTLQKPEAIRRGAPFLGLGLAYLAFEWAVYRSGHFDAAYSTANYRLGWHLASNLALLCATFVGPFGTITPAWIGMALLLSGILLSGLRTADPRTTLACAALIFSSSLIFLPFDPLAIAAAVRYSFLPSVFFCCLLGSAAANLSKRPWGAGLALLVLGGWSFKTWELCRYQQESRAQEEGVLAQARERTCIDGADFQIPQSAVDSFRLFPSRVSGYLSWECPSKVASSRRRRR